MLSRALAGAYDVVHYNFGQSLFPRPIVPGSPAVAGFPARAPAALPGLVGRSSACAT